MIQIAPPAPETLQSLLDRVWPLAAGKIHQIHRSEAAGSGTPVFTVQGRYVAQGWTEWTQGFQFGAPLLVYDATGDETLLDLGRSQTLTRMAPHVTHFGVHDHGFNNISTYGNLRRLTQAGRLEASPGEQACYDLALQASGAVQAARWTTTHEGDGFIYSFNGPHSLFSDTIRSLRSLAVAHQLGHVLMDENDERVSLLDRLIQHARTTVQYNVYYGQQRDAYDVPGRVAHESIFNVNDGRYRCPSTQQGYSPFTTWTRGLAWIMLGCAEQLEFLHTLDQQELAAQDGLAILDVLQRAARVTCDFYLQQTPTCGVPYWDTGAPGLSRLGDYLDRPADPFNEHEPVDSSAAAIACQALLRMGHLLRTQAGAAEAERYWQAGLTILGTLLQEPYLASAADHQGLLLHALYHRPRGWDHVPEGQHVPSGESCMWGDYHLLEACLYTQRVLRQEPYYTFFGDQV